MIEKSVHIFNDKKTPWEFIESSIQIYIVYVQNPRLRFQNNLHIAKPPLPELATKHANTYLLQVNIYKLCLFIWRVQWFFCVVSGVSYPTLGFIQRCPVRRLTHNIMSLGNLSKGWVNRRVASCNDSVAYVKESIETLRKARS